MLFGDLQELNKLKAEIFVVVFSVCLGNTLLPDAPLPSERRIKFFPLVVALREEKM